MAEDDRFYVKTLRMQNFRCFEDVELGPFDPHFNLLVGENGAGKSAVLAALARIVRHVGGLPKDSETALLRRTADFRYEYNAGPNKFVTFKRASQFSIDASISFNMKKFRASEQVDYVDDTRFLYSIYDVDGGYRNIPGRSVHGNLLESLCPVVAFYGTDRGLSNFLEMNLDDIRWKDRESAFRDWRSVKFAGRELKDWFKTETISLLQSLERERNTGKIEIRMLHIVNYAISNILPNAIQVRFDADIEDIVVDYIGGETIAYSSMSDGQRTLIGLFADLSRRACVLNSFYLGANSIAETPGLVLIDEIDLHLHPKWQRQIVPALKKVFPKIQFFATTHSPQVIGECQPHEIVLLTPQGQKRPGPSGSYGRDSNWVLECIMGAEGRKPEVAKQLRSIWDAVEKGHFRKARAQIKKLRKETGDDPEIIGIESYMWRVEHGGDEAAE